jgi:hypothetical protein
MSLERELQVIGAALAWPETPDLSDGVRARIEHETRTSWRPVLRRRSLALVAALVFAVIVAVMSVPQARTALLRVFGIGAVDIVNVDELPAVAPRSDLSSLGPPLSRVEVEELFPEALLSFADGLREPDELRALDRPSIASYVWRDEQGGVRLLVSQVVGRVPGIRFVKVTGPSATVERLIVDGRDAFWIAGDAHGFGLDSGSFEEIRLSRGALLVDEGTITIRIEGDLDRDDAIDVYRSLR